MKTVTIGERAYKRLLRAEAFAQAHRAYITMRACDQTQAQLDDVFYYLQAWMRLSPRKIAYGKPKALTTKQKWKAR